MILHRVLPVPEPARLALRWVCHHESELYLRFSL